MAAGLPVLAARIGALPELLDDAQLTRPGDAAALAGALTLPVPAIAAQRALDRIRDRAAPDRVAAALATIYGAGIERRVRGAGQR
jgi:glycosyltransferase involved in cell wall biosynthesis